MMRHAKLLAMIVAAVALVAACSGSEAKKAKFFEKGKALYEAGDYKMARLELKNVLQIDPKHPQAYYYLGMIGLKEKDFRAAMGSFSQAVSLDPSYLPAQLELAKIYVASNQLDKARESLDVIFKTKPDDADALLVKIAILIGEKKPDEALALIDQRRAAGETRQDIYILASTVYSQRKDTDAIERTLKEGTVANPKAVALHLLLVRLYAQTNRLDQAAAALKDIIAIEPDKPDHQYALADLYWRANRRQDADAVLQGLRAKLTSEEDWLRLANFFLTRPDPEKAEATLNEALGQFAQGVKVRLALAEIHIRQNKRDAAKKILSECLTFGLKDDNADLIGAKNALAQVYLAGAEIDEAEKLVGEVLGQNPANIDALFSKGNIRLARNDATAAVAAFRTVTRERPEFMNGHLRLAQAHLAANETALALDVLGNALKINPKARDIRMALAKIYANGQEFALAESQLAAILEQFPQDIQTRAAIGDVVFAQKKFKDAEKHYGMLKSAAPESPLGYLKMARVHGAQTQWPQAQAVLEEGLGKTTEVASLLTGIVQIFLAQNKPQDAVAYLEKRIGANEKDALACTLLGRVYLTMKEYAKAETAIRKAIAIEPLWDAPHANLAQALIAQGKKDTAIKELEQSIAKDPKNLVAHMSLGLLYQQSQDWANAEKIYAKALEVQPNLWQAANNLAAMISDTTDVPQELARARQFAEKALSLQPENPIVMDTFGWVLYKLGSHAEALQWLEKAHAKDPDHTEINYHLGMALHKAGRVDEAKAKLTKALETNQPFRGRDEAERVVRN